MGPCVVRPLFIHFDHGMIKDVTITCCWCSKRLFSRSLTKIFCSLFFFLLSSAALTCSPNHRWVWLETHCDSYFVWGKSSYCALVVQYSQVVMVCKDKKIEVVPLLQTILALHQLVHEACTHAAFKIFTLEVLSYVISLWNALCKEKIDTFFAVLERSCPFFRAF